MIVKFYTFFVYYNFFKNYWLKMHSFLKDLGEVKSTIFQKI